MTTATTTKRSNALHYALWVVQVLLALAFLMAGGMKLASSNADLLAAGMTWVERFPSFMHYVIGGAEALGAIGLIAPAITRIQPKLTALAGACLALVMLLAAGDHAVAGEMASLGAPVVLGFMAAFVAWGRSMGAPIEAR